MKLIIAGGRDYSLSIGQRLQLDQIVGTITEVVSGGATGVDASGEAWAQFHGIPVKRFPADWRRLGKKAGPIRNGQMADYADAVALFPGGRGTADMHRQAQAKGLLIYDFRKP